MASKFFLLATLVGLANCVQYQQQSAASPSQIAYAISQGYDNTGPGVHLPQPTTEAPSTTPQPQVYHHPQANYHAQSHQHVIYSNSPQTPYPQYHQQAYQSYQSPHIAYSKAAPVSPKIYQPAIYLGQPQQLGQSQLFHRAQMPVVSYQQAPQAYQVAYQQAPVAYSQQNLMKGSLLKPQAESYVTSPQYAYSYDMQDSQGADKGQQEVSQGSYQGDYSSFGVAQRQPSKAFQTSQAYSAPKTYSSSSYSGPKAYSAVQYVQAPPAYVQPAQMYVQPAQAYVGIVNKPYSGLPLKAYSGSVQAFAAPKAYVSPKYATQVAQQYSYSH